MKLVHRAALALKEQRHQRLRENCAHTTDDQYDDLWIMCTLDMDRLEGTYVAHRTYGITTQ